MVDPYEISELGLEQTEDGWYINHKLIDSNNNFYFSSLLMDNKDIFSYTDDFEDRINYIISKYNDKVNKFVSVIDYGEAWMCMEYEHFKASKPNLEKLINIFEKHNLLNKLVWRSNGASIDYSTQIKFEPITTFLGQNIDMCFNVSERKFTHNFLSLYRGYKPFREDFHCFLEMSGIIKKTLYSYNAEFLDSNEYTYDYKVSLDKKSVTPPMLMKPGEYFKNTFCSIVYEAYWFERVVFFTEKINKCFLTAQPFIVLSCPRYLFFLKKLGFKTFDKWWDESYDDIDDNNQRLVQIKKLVLDISKWSLDKCEEVYSEMIPTLKHNQLILRKIANNRISDTYTMIEYSNSVI